jgi:hypothetical protein
MLRIRLGEVPVDLRRYAALEPGPRLGRDYPAHGLCGGLRAEAWSSPSGVGNEIAFKKNGVQSQAPRIRI